MGICFKVFKNIGTKLILYTYSNITQNTLYKWKRGGFDVSFFVWWLILYVPLVISISFVPFDSTCSCKRLLKNYIIDTDHAFGIRRIANRPSFICKSMILLSSQASDTCAFPGFLSTFVFISAKCFYRLQAVFKDFSMDGYASDLAFCSGVLSWIVIHLMWEVSVSRKRSLLV